MDRDRPHTRRVKAREHPERLEKWLSAVEKYGGGVEVAPDPMASTRSLAVVVEASSLIIHTYKFFMKRHRYKRAGAYDAKVYHMPDQDTLTRIVFVHR